MDLTLDPTLQSCLDDLAAKAGTGTLTPAEQHLYEEYVEGVDLLGIFKAKARSLLRDVWQG